MKKAIKREPSMAPPAVRARERRVNAMLKREEDKFNAQVRAFMKQRKSFDEAWIAAGGLIIDDAGGLT